MHILLSAYSCDPARGSEPGIGWRWCIEYARAGHTVDLLTFQRSLQPIQKSIEVAGLAGKIRVHIPRMPPWMHAFYRMGPVLYLHYALWQVYAYFAARQLIQQREPDFIHHLTMTTLASPTWLWLLPPPFVFGPVGGGEMPPRSILTGLTPRMRLEQGARSLWCGIMTHCNPLFHATCRRAALLLAVTEQSRVKFPAACRGKSAVLSSVGLEPTCNFNFGEESACRPTGSALKLLYVGRLLYWKGLHIALHAFSLARSQGVSLEMTLVGKGRDADVTFLKNFAARLPHTNEVNWAGWLPRNELDSIYSTHDLFLYPTFHDSGGMAVCEAMQHRLPVITLDLGKPPELIAAGAGIVLDTYKQSPAALAEKMAAIFCDLARDPSKLQSMRKKLPMLLLHWGGQN
jgi:glycosyltransferase involved in cell wall biosynthesis